MFTPCLSVPCLSVPCLSVPCLSVPCLSVPCLSVPCLYIPCLSIPCSSIPCLFRVYFMFIYLSMVEYNEESSYCDCIRFSTVAINQPLLVEVV